MLFALGAASSAIDLLSSLIPSSSSSPTPNGQSGIIPASSFSITNPTTTAPSITTGGSGGSQLSPSTWNTLLAAQSQTPQIPQTTPTSRSQALQDLFSQIDANGDGQITKQEFENALGAGGTNLQMADDVFSKMDSNGDGQISLSEMQQALQGQSSTDGTSGQVHHHHHHHGRGAGGAGGADSASGANGAGGSAGGNDPLMQALQGATSTSTTNSDGSTTTTLTYADGTKITMTQAAAGSTTSSGNGATQSYNFTERMIERQAQLISANATQSLSMSV
jgi:EF-hand domain pair